MEAGFGLRWCRSVFLMAGWSLPPALLLLVLLCAQPCHCGRAPASSQAVTARLAAKWPATPLLLEARCVQPPPLPPPPSDTAFLGRRAGPLGRGREQRRSRPWLSLGGLRGQEEGGALSSLRCAG